MFNLRKLYNTVFGKKDIWGDRRGGLVDRMKRLEEYTEEYGKLQRKYDLLVEYLDLEYFEEKIEAPAGKNRLGLADIWNNPYDSGEARGYRPASKKKK